VIEIPSPSAAKQHQTTTATTRAVVNAMKGIACWVVMMEPAIAFWREYFPAFSSFLLLVALAPINPFACCRFARSPLVCHILRMDSAGRGTWRGANNRGGGARGGARGAAGAGAGAGRARGGAVGYQGWQDDNVLRSNSNINRQQGGGRGGTAGVDDDRPEYVHEIERLARFISSFSLPLSLDTLELPPPHYMTLLVCAWYLFIDRRAE
jgi:hypothetical protein